jgi:hypothetical protein
LAFSSIDNSGGGVISFDRETSGSGDESITLSYQSLFNKDQDELISSHSGCLSAFAFPIRSSRRRSRLFLGPLQIVPRPFRYNDAVLFGFSGFTSSTAGIFV